MFRGFSVSFSPIGPWPRVVAAAVAVMVLTLWAYAGGSEAPAAAGGGWRWACGCSAVLLCLLAAFGRRSILQEKKKQAASLVFLMDSSTSMS